MIKILWKTLFLKKLKLELTDDPEIPLLNTSPKELPPGSCIIMFITTLFTIAKTWTQLRYPQIDERIRNI